MVSFAGGLPAPETFIHPDLTCLPEAYLQYGPSEGEEELRTLICSDLAKTGLHCNPSQILILSGSQQGIDLVAKLFIDPGTVVAVESPTYLAALQVFRFFGARFVPLNSAKAPQNSGGTSKPALMYTIPTFQNPTGKCYTRAERAALAELCDEQGIPLFEDDPYRDLVYQDCERTPVCAMVEEGSWIYQGSFSKTLAPGLRLGYLACSPDLVPYLTRLKQAADLHSNRLSQWLVMQHLTDPARDARMKKLVETYRIKRNRFADLLDKYFGELAQWDIPRGGLFFWLKLNRKLDTRALLTAAIEENVAFMPGELFFPESLTEATAPQGYLRLNFSHAPLRDAERGLRILSRLVSAKGEAAVVRVASPVSRVRSPDKFAPAGC
ncbi:MAG: PLP-dependent aminotransferase family protein [Pseudohongiellaceae bacterium]